MGGCSEGEMMQWSGRVRIVEEEIRKETRADLVERLVARGVVRVVDTGRASLITFAVGNASLCEFEGIFEVLEDATSEADTTRMVVVEDNRRVAGCVETRDCEPAHIAAVAEDGCWKDSQQCVREGVEAPLEGRRWRVRVIGVGMLLGEGIPNGGRDADDETIRGEFGFRKVGLDGNRSIRTPGLVGVVANDGFADGQLGELNGGRCCVGACVTAVSRNLRVGCAGKADEISEVLGSLDEIGDAADAAANGIQEVARATDGQAQNIEEVTTTIQTVRDRADETEAASGRITDATGDQVVAIDDLEDRVDRLCGRADLASPGTDDTASPRHDGGSDTASTFEFDR